MNQTVYEDNQTSKVTPPKTRVPHTITLKKLEIELNKWLSHLDNKWKNYSKAKEFVNSIELKEKLHSSTWLFQEKQSRNKIIQIEIICNNFNTALDTLTNLDIMLSKGQCSIGKISGYRYEIVRGQGPFKRYTQKLICYLYVEVDNKGLENLKAILKKTELKEGNVTANKCVTKSTSPIARNKIMINTVHESDEEEDSNDDEQEVEDEDEKDHIENENYENYLKFIGSNDLYQLGLNYKNGYRVQVNYEKAAEYFKIAANKHHAGAQYYLALFYMDGVGVKQNLEEAFKWTSQSAEQNDCRGQHKLGQLYQYGLGTSVCYEEAVKWYMQSADQGYPYAQSSLSYMYANGLGVTKNYEEANKWYTKAAEQGFACKNSTYTSKC